MELSWLEPERLDQSAVAGAVAVLEAARAVDTPFLPPRRTSAFVALLRHGFDGDPPLTVVGTDGSGRVLGLARIIMPPWDNHHLAVVQVTIDPRCRRQGLGRRLHQAATERVRAHGRRLVCSSTYTSAGGAFLKALGFQPALTLVYRRMDLLAVDPDRLLAAAGALDADYELVRLAGEVPEEMVADVVDMSTAINDAPTGALEFEAEVFSPQRLRAFERAERERGRRIYRVIACERATGALAGHTVVGVDQEQPWHASQYDTSVVRAHRGHRLGYHLKADMVRWLRQVEPQLRTIDTDNASDNVHMIRINEELGFELLATEVEWQLPL